MDIVLTVIVFLLGWCAGLLVLGILRAGRQAERFEALLEYQTEVILYAAARSSQEQIKHRDAVAAVLGKEARGLASQVVREVRAVAKDRRQSPDRASDLFALGEQSREPPPSPRPRTLD